MSLVRGLPARLEAAMAVALHVPEDSPSALPAILSREGPLPAAHASRITLTHPLTRKRVQFTAPMPAWSAPATRDRHDAARTA